MSARVIGCSTVMASTSQTVSGSSSGSSTTHARAKVGAEQMPACEAQVRTLYTRMVRITIAPEWAKLLDFETQLPRPVEELVRQRSAG
jgi:hypothetical protein